LYFQFGFLVITNSNKWQFNFLININIIKKNKWHVLKYRWVGDVSTCNTFNGQILRSTTTLETSHGPSHGDQVHVHSAVVIGLRWNFFFFFFPFPLSLPQISCHLFKKTKCVLLVCIYISFSPHSFNLYFFNPFLDL
jgi:hypothetical protein